MSSMHYIREIAQPLNVISYGYTTDMGGLGSFDATMYEEVQGELPLGAVIQMPKVAQPPVVDASLSASTSQQLSDKVAQLQAQLAALMAQLSNKN